ncbi:hypothetical protein QBC43DRAFT_290313 [Cladorrhinum sp. PSN259]|nr:hypothetical protein QBC43DRAFT_290313 [Cladorrhinum sp. PSN259]
MSEHTAPAMISPNSTPDMHELEEFSNFCLSVARDEDLFEFGVLSQSEADIALMFANSSDPEAHQEYFERLNYHEKYYLSVRSRLLSLVRIWDRVIENKVRFDKNTVSTSPDFMKSFNICFELVSERAKLGVIGDSDDESDMAEPEDSISITDSDLQELFGDITHGAQLPESQEKPDCDIDESFEQARGRKRQHSEMDTGAEGSTSAAQSGTKLQRTEL